MHAWPLGHVSLQLFSVVVLGWRCLPSHTATPGKALTSSMKLIGMINMILIFFPGDSFSKIKRRKRLLSSSMFSCKKRKVTIHVYRNLEYSLGQQQFNMQDVQVQMTKCTLWHCYTELVHQAQSCHNLHNVTVASNKLV